MKVFKGMVKGLAVCAMLGISTVGCNTIGGVGKDIGEGGRAIDNAADDVHEDIHDNDRSKLQREPKAPRTHTISASAESGGAIHPSGKTSVARGSSKTFIATAHSGYSVDDLVVDKHSIGALPYLFQDNSSSYTFENVAANHVITSSFTITKSR